MRFQLFGGLGDELGFTPLVRVLRKRMPRERFLLEGGRFLEIWEHNPYVPGGDEDSGLAIRVSHDMFWDAGSLPRKFARQVGIELIDDVPELFLTDAEKAEDFGVADWKRTVAIDTWATTPGRRWPGERFVELTEKLQAKGWRVVEVGRHGGPRIPAWKTFHNALTVRQTAAVIRRCALYVGNDSGLFHLAAAVGTPQVGIFGTVPPPRRLYWNSVSVRSQNLCPNACHGQNLCKVIPEGSRCLPEIPAADVLEAVDLAARRHGRG